MRLKVGDNRYAEKFPVTRPMPNRRLKVWNEFGELLGEGVSMKTWKKGVGIFSAGRRFDSDYVLYWEYDDDKESS